MIGIIDYGLGNLASIQNMLRRLELDCVISSDPQLLKMVDRLILPGVGAFDQGITNLHEAGLWDPLHELVLGKKKPILGICLGVQLLTEGSDEGKLSGLGWIRGRTVSFDRSRLASHQRIPNMGWRFVDISRQHSLTESLSEDARFYFVHSFHLNCNEQKDVILSANYGYAFPCAVARNNVLGVQFHPEKSHRFGMQILKNFAMMEFDT